VEAGRLVAPPQAEQKGSALLRFRLSPEQAEQHSSYQYFDVIGSRYRIRHGRMMNIDELDSAGNKVREWCFLSEGKLAAVTACWRRRSRWRRSRAGPPDSVGVDRRLPKFASEAISPEQREQPGAMCVEIDSREIDIMAKLRRPQRASRQGFRRTEEAGLSRGG
jgi:hypothetical protein